MKNLTNYQKRFLDKIYPPLLSVPPLEELNRLTKLYRDFLNKEEDPYINKAFNKTIEKNLYLTLKQTPEFYNLDFFKINYLELVNDYIEDNIDVDESDFKIHYIEIQKQIIDKSFKYFIHINSLESLEIIQFVSDDFFEEFIPSSRKKIDFLSENSSDSLATNNLVEVEYENPYPDIFISYGYEIFNSFMEHFPTGIKLAPVSFIVDKLKTDGLINPDKNYTKMFNFILENTSINIGTATKFKSNFSNDKYLPTYKEIKKRYSIVPE